MGMGYHHRNTFNNRKTKRPMKTDPQFFELVYKMREAQKAFFKNKMNRDLQASKELEREVDTELSKRIVGYKYGELPPKEVTGKLF
jgi:hypothetical protein